MNSGQELITSGCRLWAPPPDLTCSQWVDRYRYLSSESSAEHGKATCLSFQREMLDSISDPRIRRTVIKSCTQIAKTFCIENGIGYFAHMDPGPMLVLQPGSEDAKDFSKERIAPMIRDTPVLRSIFSESKSRSSDSTITEKLFPGGMLALAGAGSARNVARRAIRFLFCDEIDKYDPTNEGHAIALARKRLATFRHRAKEIDTCSPTVEGSEIDKAYEESDKREFYVPCARCGHMQSMMLKFQQQVRWDSELPTRQEQARSARYHCEGCDEPWDDSARMAAVEHGEWRAHEPFAGIAGFWISELYSPWKLLSEIVLDYLSKKDDPEDLRTFVNTSLAENWIDKGEAPEWRRLYERTEPFPLGTVPLGGLFITAGADVQADRIEVQFIAWGDRKQSWTVDYVVLPGRPSEEQVWVDLDEQLNRVFPHESGTELPVMRFAIDSGFATQEVYAWSRRQGPGRVLVVKGQDHGAAVIGQPTAVDVTWRGKKFARGAKVWPVNTWALKSELYGWLNLERPTRESDDPYPSGYCHFPELGEEFFKQLTAEQLVTRLVKGYKRQEWQKIRERNEALDTWIYARAAASQGGIDRFTSKDWDVLSGRVRVAEEAKSAPVFAPAVTAQPTTVTRRITGGSAWIPKRSNWLSR